METLSFSTLIAVFEEMCGPTVFWVLAAAAVVVGIAFLYVLFFRRPSSRMTLVAQIIGVIGGVGGLLFVQAFTDSSFADIGGPIDVILLLGIWLFNAVGTAMLAFTFFGLISRRD